MKLQKLEALRGFAALYVVLHHSIPSKLIFAGFNFGIFFRFGQEAVILFFLLSGFVINYSFQTGKNKSFKSYFYKRFFRIYIPLVMILFLGYVIKCVRESGIADPEWSNLLLNLIMLQDLGNLKPNVVVEPYLHNAPLWSLSYEWWFYMLFFPIATRIHSTEMQARWVFGLAIVASAVYTCWPTFIPRLLMYMAIWWSGVYLSNLYIEGEDRLTFASCKLPIAALLMVTLVAVGNAGMMYVHEHTKVAWVYPFLEARHMIFAFISLLAALMWNKMGWTFFDGIFGPFLSLSSISYVIYISHYYLVTDAAYLVFIDSKLLQWLGYMLSLFIFSYLVEVVLYPRIRSVLTRFVFS